MLRRRSSSVVREYLFRNLLAFPQLIGPVIGRQRALGRTRLREPHEAGFYRCARRGAGLNLRIVAKSRGIPDGYQSHCIRRSQQRGTMIILSASRAGRWEPHWKAKVLAR